MTLRIRRIALHVVMTAGVLGAACGCSAAPHAKSAGTVPTTSASVERATPADGADQAAPGSTSSTSSTSGTSRTTNGLGGPSSAELSNLDSSINGALTSGQTSDSPALTN